MVTSAHSEQGMWLRGQITDAHVDQVVATLQVGITSLSKYVEISGKRMWLYSVTTHQQLDGCGGLLLAGL